MCAHHSVIGVTPNAVRLLSQRISARSAHAENSVWQLVRWWFR